MGKGLYLLTSAIHIVFKNNKKKVQHCFLSANEPERKDKDSIFSTW